MNFACVLLASTIGLSVGSPVVQGVDRLAFNSAKRCFSVNKVDFSPEEWNVLVRHSDLVCGLDSHGYQFPGALARFRSEAPRTPVYCFETAMGIQQDSLVDWRFKYLDRDEEAFLHSADPSSLKVVILEGVTRLFWMRDYRNAWLPTYPDPIGVTEYIVESAPAREGPWSVRGLPVLEDGSNYYGATIPEDEPLRWYRVKSRLRDTGEIAVFSWPTQPDPAPTGIASLKVNSDLTFEVGVWGVGPSDPAAIMVEWGRLNSWGYENRADAKSGPEQGITTYLGTITNIPTGRPWVIRVRNEIDGVTSPTFEPSRRNNRIISRYGERLFKPDHPRSLAMHRRRLGDSLTIGANGVRLDFVIDSYLSWYVATLPRGDDVEYQDIEPRLVAMLQNLRETFPQAKMLINGISVTRSFTGVYDFLPYVDGADCEFIGWSDPNQLAPFRDADMLDGTIGVAHHRGQIVCGYSYAGEENHEARITSIARYWLVWAPTVYYQYMTQNYHQSVDYVPELDVDMGVPIQSLLSSRADLAWNGVYRRVFTNGMAIYNPNPFSQNVDLGTRFYVVNLHGGLSKKQGGSGFVTFDGPVTSLVLGASRGALVVRTPRLRPDMVSGGARAY